ncbi:MAG TPA: NAD(P)/FAD-dependent oxidoreductase [Acidisarcina sp.]
MPKRAIIIGAGPAGLTAALEFLTRSDIKPIVLEASQEIGGISRTIRYKGNRMDIGGHRFFSKSDRVMNWWLDLMPVEAGAANGAGITYQNRQRSIPVKHPAAPPLSADLVMLVRPRKSRIYYLRQFFDYPIKLTGPTLGKLGPLRSLKIALSYLASRLNPIKAEISLEDFLINRFGRELYRTFFESYTEKVWGTPCRQISAEWGAQRIKGLSLTSALKHFIKSTLSSGKTGLAQKNTETSLIEQFLYPKFGPGQLWEHVADLIRQRGGEIHLGMRVEKINVEENLLTSLGATAEDGGTETFAGDYFFSTMPVVEVINSLANGGATIPANVRQVADGLEYRDFITVGILADKLLLTEADGSLLKDTWIYIQETQVQLGRLQIFNNWSPHMVADPEKVWLGLEYFCYQDGELWKMPDDKLIDFAAGELAQIGILRREDVMDGCVVRVPKTYPAYFGTYDRFDEIRQYTDSFENLFLVGRNGMHKYNNQDHSMLTAMTAVDKILSGDKDKASLWSINTEQGYNEEK